MARQKKVVEMESPKKTMKKGGAKKKKTTDRHWLTAPAMKRIIAARVGKTATKKDSESGKEVSAFPRLSKDAVPVLQKAGERALKKIVDTCIMMLGSTHKTITEKVVDEAIVHLGLSRLEKILEEPKVTKDISEVKNRHAGEQTCLAAASVEKAVAALADKGDKSEKRRTSAVAKVHIRAYVEEVIGRLIQDADRFRHAGNKGTLRKVELDFAKEVSCHTLFQ